MTIRKSWGINVFITLINDIGPANTLVTLQVVLYTTRQGEKYLFINQVKTI